MATELLQVNEEQKTYSPLTELIDVIIEAEMVLRIHNRNTLARSLRNAALNLLEDTLQCNEAAEYEDETADEQEALDSLFELLIPGFVLFLQTLKEKPEQEKQEA